MPLYDYAAVGKGCPTCRKGFEVMQKLSEPKLKKCPACKRPVERLISKVALGGKYALTPNKIKNSGMTQYKKAGDGYYERTAGTKGPAVIGPGQKVKPSDF